jgi:hypothetical protein
VLVPPMTNNSQRSLRRSLLTPRSLLSTRSASLLATLMIALLDLFSQATPSPLPRDCLTKLALTLALPKILLALLPTAARAMLNKPMTLQVPTQTLPRTLPAPLPIQPTTLQALPKILARVISNKPLTLPALMPIRQRSLQAPIQGLLKTLPAPMQTQPKTPPALLKIPPGATSNKPPTWPQTLQALLKRPPRVRIDLLNL